MQWWAVEFRGRAGLDLAISEQKFGDGLMLSGRKVRKSLQAPVLVLITSDLRIQPEKPISRGLACPWTVICTRGLS